MSLRAATDLTLTIPLKGREISFSPLYEVVDLKGGDREGVKKKSRTRRDFAFTPR